MKRLQILIEKDLDDALERQARVERTSKAALIRTYVRERLKGHPPLEADPLWQMIGADDFEPASVDDVVYRWRSSIRPSGSRCETGATAITTWLERF